MRPSDAESGTGSCAEAAAADVSPLRLALPYEPASLEQARLAVLQHVAGLNLSPRAIYRLELVLEEGLMNRLWHAWPEEAPERQTECILVTLQALPDAVELRFEDEGAPFDPTRAAPAPAPASLAQASPGGLGLVLTRKAVRSMHYERRDERNCVTLQIVRD